MRDPDTASGKTGLGSERPGPRGWQQVCAGAGDREQGKCGGISVCVPASPAAQQQQQQHRLRPRWEQGQQVSGSRCGWYPRFTAVLGLCRCSPLCTLLRTR